MSLYIGKDDSNQNVLAITNNNISENLIKAQVTDFSNFSFHSKAGYMFNDVLEYTVTWPTGYKVASINIPVSYMVNSGITRTVFIFIDGTYVTVTTGGAPVVTGYTKAYYYNKTDGILYLYDSTKASGSVSNILIIVTNYYGLTLRNEPNNYSGSVVLNSSQFLVQGVDIFSKKWLCTPPVNNIDKVINILGINYQIVNYVPSVGIFTLDTSSGVKILKGGKAVVDTSIAGFSPLMPNSYAGTQTQTNYVYLHRSSGSNSPIGFGNTSFPQATVTFPTNIPADNSLILLHVVNSMDSADSSVILMNTSNSSWIDYGIGFVPSDTGVGYCNIRFGVRITANNIQLSVDGGNCNSNTNDAYPYIIASNYYIRYVYVNK